MKENIGSLRRGPAWLLPVLASLALVHGPAIGQSQRFTKVQLTPKFYAEGISVGDIDKDGVSDIACGSYWYKGPEYKTKTEFYPVKEFPDGYADNRISWVYDVTGDGWNDYIHTTAASGVVYWYENPKGAAGHWQRYTAVTMHGNEAPTFADITGDGKPELVAVIPSGGFPGDWEPGTDPKQPWKFTPISSKGGLGAYSHGIGIGDINKDGKLDLVYFNGWYEQPKTSPKDPWTHHPYKFYAELYSGETSTGGAQIYVGDIDGDGDVDIFTSLQAHGYGLAWFENDGTGNQWTEHRLMGTPAEESKYGVFFSQPHAMNWGDFDGDGLVDIITGKRFGTHGPHLDMPPVLYMFKLSRQGGKATYTPILLDSQVGVGNMVGVADPNKDGKPDILIATKAGAYLFRNEMPSTGILRMGTAGRMESLGTTFGYLLLDRELRDAMGRLKPNRNIGDCSVPLCGR